MAVQVRDGEKIFYNKDYANGRSKSTGNITVTDKRIIHTVESKRGAAKTEIDIDEIDGVKVQFKPSSVILFIVGVILSAIISFGIMYVRSADAFELAGTAMYALFGIYGVIALFCLVKGAFLIRNGFYVGIYAGLDNFSFVSVGASMGKVKPLYLKTKKDTALLIQSELSAAVIGAKYNH